MHGFRNPELERQNIIEVPAGEYLVEANIVRITDNYSQGAIMDRVLITGANGFIGSHLTSHLINCGDWMPKVVSRRPISKLPQIEQGHADAATSRDQWRDLLAGCKCVVHTAARAHILKETSPAPEALYHAVNVKMTENLARAAIDVGVKRFIYISSIGVHGDSSREPMTEQSPMRPASLYASSKLEAERLLMALAETSDMEVCVLRPPLVYGPGVGANFLSLIKVADSRLPLPLGRIDNRRSFINTINLVHLIETCLSHPAAANEIFVTSDGEDISTPGLLSLMAELLGKPSGIFPFPPSALRFAAKLLGQQKRYEKMSASLTVDSTKATQLLHWRSVCSLREGLVQTLTAYQGRD